MTPTLTRRVAAWILGPHPDLAAYRAHPAEMRSPRLPSAVRLHPPAERCRKPGPAQAVDDRGLHHRDGSEPTGPTKIITVDIDKPLPEVSAIGPGGQRYRSLWVVVRWAGRPVALVETDFDGTRLRPKDLGRRIAGHLPGNLRRIACDTPLPDPALPTASVVVPTMFARPELLESLIESLAALDYPRFEVLIVDNRRPDSAMHQPPAWAARFPNVRILHEPRPGISAARNRGLLAATGEIVAFTDDDVEVDRRWLRSLVEPLVRNPDVACVNGLVVPRELETPAQRWFEDFYGGFNRSFERRIYDIEHPDPADPLFPYRPGKFGTGANMAARAEALRSIGGFDPLLGTGTPARGGEDLALCILLLTAGYRIAVEPSAVVYHTHRRTEDEFRRQVHDYGIGLTAMFAAIICRDPRHALAICQRIPRAARALLAPVEEAHAGARPAGAVSYPAGLRRRQVTGMIKGPFAYTKSWWNGRAIGRNRIAAETTAVGQPQWSALRRPAAAATPVNPGTCRGRNQGRGERPARPARQSPADT